MTKSNAPKKKPRTAPGKVWWVVRETLTNLYATLTFGEWVRESPRAAKFRSRAEAQKFARALKAGPRQFAGLGQKTRVEEVPS